MRTQLFLQEIAAGNASLLLSRVRMKDEGRYKCYTSTSARNDESFVNVQVKGRCGRMIERNSILRETSWREKLLLRTAEMFGRRAEHF